MRCLNVTLLLLVGLSGLVQPVSGQEPKAGKAAAEPAAVTPKGPVWAYQRPGTPEVAGVRHLMLVYRTSKPDAKKLFPYVAYVSGDGKPKDWFFDSFVWMEYQTPEGIWLHSPGQGQRPVVKADWDWLMGYFFDPAHGVTQLDAAVQAAAKQLGQSDRLVNVVLSLPRPHASAEKFGAVAAGGPSLNFSREADRQAALQWYIRTVQTRFKKLNAKHVRLVGFYWTPESINEDDHALLRATSKYIHSQGLKLFWIPYLVAHGTEVWRELGIDGAMLQPNYFFDPKTPTSQLAEAAFRALRCGTGIELEIEGTTMGDRYLDYLDASVKYGFQGALTGYYDTAPLGGCAASKDPKVRNLYDQTYQFVKGTYKPRHTSKFPDLPAVPLPKNPQNLALMANGGKIVAEGAYRVPGVDPARAIDGRWQEYSGSEGFLTFAWPGYFTVELPKTQEISRTDVLLWEKDKRTFRYQIEVSTDGNRWRRVVDKSKVESSGWQTDRFSPAPARFVRFHGLHNSLDTNYFQVVEFEVYR